MGLVQVSGDAPAETQESTITAAGLDPGRQSDVSDGTEPERVASHEGKRQPSRSRGWTELGGALRTHKEAREGWAGTAALRLSSPSPDAREGAGEAGPARSPVRTDFMWKTRTTCWQNRKMRPRWGPPVTGSRREQGSKGSAEVALTGQTQPLWPLTYL